MDRWKKTDYPQWGVRAKRENALIFFADASGLRSEYHAATPWAEPGKTPIVKATGKRYSLTRRSAVNALGHFRFMGVAGRVTATGFRDFLRRLIMGIERKIVRIMDGHPIHKANLVKAFVQANATKLELSFLPPYAPELNPDERVWGPVNAKVAKQVAATQGEMKEKLLSALHSLQKLPELVSRFFQAPPCYYAAI